MRYLLLLLAISASANEPQYSLSGGKYEEEYTSINTNFLQISNDLKELKTLANATSDTSGFATKTGTQTFSGIITFSGITTFSQTPLGPIHTSSQAARLTSISWGMSGLVCQSTLTITGSTITINASGYMQTPGAGSFVAGYLIDSRCPSGHTCSSTLLSNLTPWRGEMDTNATFTIAARETQSYGAHTICIWAGHTAGTVAAGLLEFWLEGN